MNPEGVALSIKQPWASLILAGLKTVEVRTWPTNRRGPIFLHAARVPDSRPHGWTFVTDELRNATTTGGGIVGMAEIVDCVEYRDEQSFAADLARHRNQAEWFRPPVLYGFVLEKVQSLPFHRVPGNTGFFAVRVPISPSPELPREPESKIAVPPPPPRVIIIDPPEGQEALRHDANSTLRSAD